MTGDQLNQLEELGRTVADEGPRGRTASILIRRAVDEIRRLHLEIRRLHLVVAELNKLVDDLKERLEEIAGDGS